MTANDARGLTYTSAPLSKDVEVTGHPLIHLWLSTTAKDVDLFAYLEEVDRYGYSHYVTEGSLRASLRKSSPAPYNNMDLPFQRSNADDKAELVSNQAYEVVFDLLPTSRLFRKGGRLRVSITGADKDNFQTIAQAPAPKLTIYRDPRRASRIILPIIPTDESEGMLATSAPDAENTVKVWVLISIAISGLALAGAIAVIFFRLKGKAA